MKKNRIFFATSAIFSGCSSSMVFKARASSPAASSPAASSDVSVVISKGLEGSSEEPGVQLSVDRESTEPSAIDSGDLTVDVPNEEADPNEETDDSDVSALDFGSESEPGPGDSFIGQTAKSTAEPQSLASGDDPTNEEAEPDEETDDSDVSALESGQSPSRARAIHSSVKQPKCLLSRSR